MRKNKIIKKIIIIILIAVSLVISLDKDRPLTNIEIVLKELLLPLNKSLTLNKTCQTNAADSYTIQKEINLSLEQEISSLKEILELKHTNSEYDIENAKVISRNEINWINSLTIDKGSDDGIKVDSAVITPNGLIGKIITTTPNFSEVKLLTTNDSTYKTSVVINVNHQDYYAILTGYDKEQNLLIVTAIDKNIPTQANDSVLTSGLGNMPKGIYIGKIISSKVDKYDLSKTLYVKPDQDFNSINYVTVLKEKSK